MVDVGTGDGLFVYQSALEHPEKLYIGLDANASPLEKLSEKIYRKPSRGGAPNALFLHAAIEDLPSELDGTANEVNVQFPWGSLLRVVASGELETLRCLRRMCAAGARLEIVIGLDTERDRSEMMRLGLKPLTEEYLENELKARYCAAGFEIIQSGLLNEAERMKLISSWATRLRANRQRRLICIKARAA